MQSIDPPPGLSRRFDLAHTEVEIAGHHYDLLRPRNVDDLISEEDFGLDERIPYWADCWPSGRVLAERIACGSEQGHRLLELGCGIGLVSLAAARAGYHVLATDYYADALEFTAANATRHRLTVDTRLVDWRRLPKDLGRFDVVAASDVLYESPQAALVAAAFSRTLKRDGLGLICDPGRRAAPAFIALCPEFGLEARSAGCMPIIDDGVSVTVSIFEVRRV